MPGEPAVRGQPLLQVFERAFRRADAAVERLVAPEHNPLKLTGAIAVASFAVATVSGVLLLLWYTPSLGAAWPSVVAMGDRPFTAGLVRSLHRYGSDAAVAFTAIHLVRLFVERRFTGVRWWAWLTGVLALGVLWLVGWTGYWLVWDQRAHRVAEGTAQMLDVLPVFADPLSRAFLTDEGVNSLLFFVVFFAHMLVPVGVVVLLWLHIARLSRPAWITRGAAAAWTLGGLVALSLIWPADVAAPAHMAEVAARFTMDAWYLAPLALTDRLSGPWLWALSLGGGVALLSIPWTLRAAPVAAPAAVVEARCNACTKCYNDCPYDAIAMVPRTDGHDRYTLVSSVDPAKCVSCGICAGSCDSAGVGVPWFDALEERHRLDGWLKEDEASGRSPFVLFLCGSAGAELGVEPGTGQAAALPGWRVEVLPCAGWLHMLTVERAIRRGAAGVLIASCDEGACRYREGATWARERFEGRREPAMRPGFEDRTRRVALGAGGTAELLAEARAFEGRTAAGARSRSVPRWLGGAVVVAGSALFTLVGSDLPYATPAPALGSELAVSVKAAGEASEICRAVSEEEKAAMPVHMRRDQICERGRTEVRLLVEIDGEVAVDRPVRANGLWRDGASIAVVEVPVAVGSHRVRVAIAEGEAGTWTHDDQRELVFEADRRRVFSYDSVGGARWR